MTSPETSPLISLRGVTKRYGGRPVVDDLTFACHPGTVTGFLGPNGAGKSTALRILTGLAHPDMGEALVDGVPFGSLENPARTIGVMLDATALHGGRTGQETLRLAARTIGMPASRADDVLEQVGLANAARQRVGGYSYGMRQRLGSGVALIGDPTALVLDEPANGLDPEGIRWMRHLLRAFAASGGTVLLSSHQLREVEATVDRLVLISKGRLVREGTLDELSTEHGTRVSVEEPRVLADALARHGIASEPRGDGMVDVSLAPVDMGRLALREQIVLTSLSNAGSGSLEDVFFALTGEEQPGEGVVDSSDGSDDGALAVGAVSGTGSADAPSSPQASPVSQPNS